MRPSATWGRGPRRRGPSRSRGAHAARDPVRAASSGTWPSCGSRHDDGLLFRGGRVTRAGGRGAGASSPATATSPVTGWWRARARTSAWRSGARTSAGKNPRAARGAPWRGRGCNDGGRRARADRPPVPGAVLLASAPGSRGRAISTPSTPSRASPASSPSSRGREAEAPRRRQAGDLGRCRRRAGARGGDRPAAARNTIVPRPRTSPERRPVVLSEPSVGEALAAPRRSASRCPACPPVDGALGPGDAFRPREIFRQRRGEDAVPRSCGVVARRRLGGVGAGGPRRPQRGVLAVVWADARPRPGRAMDDLLRCSRPRQRSRSSAPSSGAAADDRAHRPLTGLPTAACGTRSSTASRPARRYGDAAVSRDARPRPLQGLQRPHGHQAGDRAARRGGGGLATELRATDSWRATEARSSPCCSRSGCPGCRWAALERLRGRHGPTGRRSPPASRPGIPPTTPPTGDRRGRRGPLRRQARRPGPRAIRRCRRVARCAISPGGVPLIT